MNSFGLNINAADVPNRDALLNWHKDARPAWVLVMDDNGLGLCDAIHAASPATRIIHRDYATHNGDDGLYKKVDPILWVEAQHKKLQGRYWAYGGNEPDFEKALIVWTFVACKRAIELKQPIVILNLGVGKPLDVDNWKLAHDVLELACKHPEYIVIGTHEYFSGQPTSGFVGGAPDGTTAKGDKDIHPDFTHEWPDNPLRLGMLWHCGRILKMYEYCRAQGWNKPRVVLTEHGADRVEDIAFWLDKLPLTPGYPKIRGWHSHRVYWQDAENTEDHYADALIYLDQFVYDELGVEGQLLFSWTNAPDWADFDVSAAPRLLARLARYNGQGSSLPPLPPPITPPPVPVPAPTPTPTPQPADTVTFTGADIQAIIELWKEAAAHCEGLAAVAKRVVQFYERKLN